MAEEDPQKRRPTPPPQQGGEEEDDGQPPPPPPQPQAQGRCRQLPPPPPIIMPDEKRYVSVDAEYNEPRDNRRTVCAVIVTILLLAGITALIVYLVYRPQNPKFSVVGAGIYDLNTTAPPFVSSTMQFTIVTRNPNRRVTIYYDRLTAYVSYHNQAITPPLPLPPLRHERRATVALSPVLGGAAVPVQPEVANGLAADNAYGVVPLRVVIVGRLKWKAGAFKTGRRKVFVRCDVLVGTRRVPGAGGQGQGQSPLLGSPGCKVDI